MLFQLVSDVLLTKTFFLNGVQLVGYTLAFVVAYKLIFIITMCQFHRWLKRFPTNYFHYALLAYCAISI